MALLFQGIARRLMGNSTAAIETLKPLSESCPDAPLVHLQLGLAFQETGHKDAANDSIRRAVTVKTDFGDAWLALGDLLTSMGDGKAGRRSLANRIPTTSSMSSPITGKRECPDSRI